MGCAQGKDSPGRDGIPPSGISAESERVPPPASPAPHERACSFAYPQQGTVRAGTHWWSPDLITLDPAGRAVVITYEVRADGSEIEMIGAFSHSKRAWGGQPQCDALSWYTATHRCDFTFRTKMFHGFPRCKRGEPCELRAGEWHRVEVTLRKDAASYAVNGRHFGTATLKPGEIPKAGYVGMVTYASGYSFRDVRVLLPQNTALPAVAAGSQAAALAPAAATEPIVVGGTPVILHGEPALADSSVAVIVSGEPVPATLVPPAAYRASA